MRRSRKAIPGLISGSGFGIASVAPPRRVPLPRTRMQACLTDAVICNVHLACSATSEVGVLDDQWLVAHAFASPSVNWAEDAAGTCVQPCYESIPLLRIGHEHDPPPPAPDTLPATAPFFRPSLKTSWITEFETNPEMRRFACHERLSTSATS